MEMGNIMIEIIESIKRELIVVFFSMIPISELRGSIPLGISLGLTPIHSAIISILGNMLIVPFLLKLLHPVMGYFEKTDLFNSTIGWVKNRSMKRASIIKRYSLIGLFIFVAIPLPTTGVWTATVIATILKLDYKKALISISLGIITAGIIVMSISHGFVNIIG